MIDMIPLTLTAAPAPCSTRCPPRPVSSSTRRSQSLGAAESHNRVAHHSEAWEDEKKRKKKKKKKKKKKNNNNNNNNNNNKNALIDCPYK